MKNTLELCRFLAALSAGDQGGGARAAALAGDPAEGAAERPAVYVSGEVMEDIRYKTLDWLGCVIGALDKKSSAGVLEMAREAGGNPQCSAFGLPGRTSMYMAAFSNGILGHTLEYDDVNKIAITHPGAAALPAALAAAEYCGADFERYALGAAAGYEVMIRLGSAVNPSHYDYWHTTGTCGTFAAAAAAGKVMGLDGEQLSRALGIAGTMASGLVCVFGTDAKLVNVGNAVENGVKAAVLAAKGYSVPEDVFEREGGYARAVSLERDFDQMCPQDGDELKILDSYYKIHASCGHTHSALDALQKIMKKHNFTVDQVEAIEVKAYKKAVDLTGDFSCGTELKAKFSMPYCIAAMAVYGETGLMQFTEQARSDPRVHGLKSRIKVEEDPSCTRRYPALRIERLCVKLKDGRQWEETVELPQGKPPREYIRKKFLSLAGLTIDCERASRIMGQVLSLKMDSSMGILGEGIRGELSGS